MKKDVNDRGAVALQSLLQLRTRFDRIDDRDFSAAVVQLARKQLVASGTRAADLKALREAIGDDLFESTLKAMSAYHLRLLAKRLDKKVDPAHIASGPGALEQVRRLLALTESATIAAPIAPPADAPPTPAVSGKGVYFGRKAFRVGD